MQVRNVKINIDLYCVTSQIIIAINCFIISWYIMNYMFSSGLAHPDFSHRFPPCWSDTSRFDSIETDQWRNKMTTTGLLNYHLPPLKFILLSITNKNQRYTYFLLLSTLYMFRAVSPPIIRTSRTVHTVSGMCRACLLLPLAWLSSNWTTLAVAANKLDIYQMLCVQFLSSWWWSKKSPETGRALTKIKNIV